MKPCPLKAVNTHTHTHTPPLILAKGARILLECETETLKSKQAENDIIETDFYPSPLDRTLGCCKRNGGKPMIEILHYG